MTFRHPSLSCVENVTVMNVFRTCLLLILLLGTRPLTAQDLPHLLTPKEKLELPAYQVNRQGPVSVQSVTPPVSPVRTIGEWEELQGFLVTWTSYTTMLRQIVAAAKLETRVYIVTNNPGSVISTLASYNIDTVNITFLNVPYNSVWSRDYGPWSAYTNEVDSLITIDWIYNRPRPLDDAIPPHVATALGTPLFQTTTSPWDLVHTGGNFMTDGFGTGFSSKLILDDNLPAAGFGVNHTPAEIDTIMNRFMGINRYIRMDKLPYDQIHHIDMHMKLLDEETLLVGEYPPGIADGPQIEANLLYVTSNFNSVFGTPYKVIRIPMPPDNGLYPHNGGDYFTYTNSSFINKTLIVPTYGIPQDTTALRIYRDALPGYTVTGINSTASIGALGALHCITKELGTSDPLLISHQPLPDTYDDVNPYHVVARMQHRSGIQGAMLYFRTDTALPYQSVAMNSLNPAAHTWEGFIPAQAKGSTVYYYVEAAAVSGKTQVRPLPAPAGYWHFEVLQGTAVQNDMEHTLCIGNVFPNPSRGITCIPVTAEGTEKVQAWLSDITGRRIMELYNGQSKRGKQHFFFNSNALPSGVYAVHVLVNGKPFHQKVIVQ